MSDLAVHVFRPQGFVQGAALALYQEMLRLKPKQRGSVVLAGGTTPRPVYEHLAARGLSGLQERIHWYFGDERCVPPGDPRSNYRMAKESLFDRLPVPAERIHRMQGERQELDAAARDYERVIPNPVDLLILGIGEDGHTASIFPKSPALMETSRRIVPAQSPAGVPWRLTITPLVIAAAQSVVVLATGAGKAKAVAQALALSGDVNDTPARLAARSNAFWLLDEAAAAELPPDVKVLWS